MKTKTYNEIKARIDKLGLLLNGGKGSGNFGHFGRLHKRGGSSKTPTNIYSQKYKEYAQRKWANKNLAHPELAYIKESVIHGHSIDYDKVKDEPAIQEALKKSEYKKDTLEEHKGDSEREKLQEELANRLLDNAQNGSVVYGKDGKKHFVGSVDRNKEAYFIIGPPAGGKSSVFANPISNKHKARIIDSDVVKEWLPEFDNGMGAGRVQNESSMIMEKALKKAIERGENIVIPKIGGSSVAKMAQELKAAGYKTNLSFNEVSEKTSVSRALARFAEEGRWLDPSYLKSIGDKPKNTFKQYANDKDYFDSASWKNNDVKFGQKPKTVLTYNSIYVKLDRGGKE